MWSLILHSATDCWQKVLQGIQRRGDSIGSMETNGKRLYDLRLETLLGDSNISSSIGHTGVPKFTR